MKLSANPKAIPNNKDITTPYSITKTKSFSFISFKLVSNLDN